MPERTTRQLELWREAFTQPTVWRCGLVIGLVAGSLQVLVNQGDIWLRGEADATVVCKSILSPRIACSIATLSAAWSDVARRQLVAETPITD